MMTDPQPTAADLAEEIIATLHARHPWRPSVDEFVSLIARHRSEQEAGLRAEVDRLRALLIRARKEFGVHPSTTTVMLARDIDAVLAKFTGDIP